ncbi:MAG TPA: hypothetical protein VGA73_15820 [Candidatus Binatia bacterium]
MSHAALIIAGAGILASGAAAFYLKSRAPRHYWLLGLAGLFPAWLWAFLTLIEPATRSAVEVPLPPRALFSSSAGLLGVIATDYLLRTLPKSGRVLKPFTCWMMGWIALVPAWLIAATGL